MAAYCDPCAPNAGQNLHLCSTFSSWLRNGCCLRTYRLGGRGLASGVTDDAPVGVEPQAPQVPDPLVPGVEPSLVTGHLALDDRIVLHGGLLRHGVKGLQITLDALEQADLEAKQV